MMDGDEPSEDRSTAERTQVLYQERLDSVFRGRDRAFAWLFVIQWIFAVGTALTISPYAWEGKLEHTHLHVYYAIFGGAALTLPVLAMMGAWPGASVTRHAVAIGQMLWSALLIHLTGGRIETHFHVFGSLAFLAFYRDWQVLVTATLVVAFDHLLRGIFWSESVYGIMNPEWWRFLEHASWVAFENVVLVMGVRESRREMRALARRQAEVEALNRDVEARVIRRTEELSESREQYRLLLETTRTIPWEWSRTEGRFTYVGPQIQPLIGWTAEQCVEPEFLHERVHADDEKNLGKLLSQHQGAFDVEFRLHTSEGKWIWLQLIGHVEIGAKPVLRGVMIDVTMSREMEMQLRQSQKLEAVGRMAAGVAHEINTPVQFITDSLQFVREASADLMNLVGKYRELESAVLAGAPALEAAARASEAEQNADLEYLCENVPKALERTMEGLDRVTAIVRAMKEFAYPDRKEMAQADLNHAISTTLTLARNEYKYVADVETDLGDIPQVVCHVGDINQVVLNIVVNAAQAIGDVVRGTEQRGKISIRTRAEGEDVLISIADTGGGIPGHVRDRIFDPFFTTKEVGRGSGQGLGIARSIVVEKHRGTLTFETEMGKGTTFYVRLPIAGSEKSSGQQAA
jgi:PAS domain S-box-containing protein